MVFVEQSVVQLTIIRVTLVREARKTTDLVTV